MITYAENFVASADGTKIGYRTLGSGPDVVLLHGAMESAHSHMGMARALADRFRVHLPDRRGRGASGPHPEGYGIHTEVADLAAVVGETSASRVFGVSEGGLIVLAAARELPAIRKVAVYEPALITEGTAYTSWLARYDREMADAKVADALVTSMTGLRLAPPAHRRHQRDDEEPGQEGGPGRAHYAAARTHPALHRTAAGRDDRAGRRLRGRQRRRAPAQRE